MSPTTRTIFKLIGPCEITLTVKKISLAKIFVCRILLQQILSFVRLLDTLGNVVLLSKMTVITPSQVMVGQTAASFHLFPP